MNSLQIFRAETSQADAITNIINSALEKKHSQFSSSIENKVSVKGEYIKDAIVAENNEFYLQIEKSYTLGTVLLQTNYQNDPNCVKICLLNKNHRINANVSSLINHVIKRVESLRASIIRVEIAYPDEDTNHLINKLMLIGFTPTRTIFPSEECRLKFPNVFQIEMSKLPSPNPKL